MLKTAGLNPQLAYGSIKCSILIEKTPHELRRNLVVSVHNNQCVDIFQVAYGDTKCPKESTVMVWLWSLEGFKRQVMKKIWGGNVTAMVNRSYHFRNLRVTEH